jgi:hypothetical protein
MSYAVTLYSTSEGRVPVDEIAAAVGDDHRVSISDGGESDWTCLLIETAAGEGAFELERHTISSGAYLAEEIDELVDDLAGAEPRNAAQWVAGYLAGCRSIHRLIFLDKGFDAERGHLPSEILATCRDHVGGGIVEADLEGFSNEEGYLITWDFEDDVSGTWAAAVLGRDGIWITFRMDLGDPDQRAAFRAGRVPDGAILL